MGEIRSRNPYYADAQFYVRGFENLYLHGLYSNELQTENPRPSVGREPGYPFLLFLFAQVDTGLQAVVKECYGNSNACLKEYATGAQWLNRMLFAGAGVLMFLCGYCLTGRLRAATICGGAIWLNKHMQKNMDYFVSDPLATFLVCAVTFTFCLVFICNRSIGLWAILGTLLAALILTKAVFYYFTILFIACFIFVLIFRTVKRRENIRPNIIKLCVFAFCALVPALMWMDRNQEVNGYFILTDTRSGIALNTRETLNHMTLPQYFTSFMYWTRGFGDNLVRDLLPKEIWDEFQIDNPNGFYLRAQLGYNSLYSDEIEQLGLSGFEATKYRDLRLMKAIISDPITHSFVTLPLIYRGVWVDQFAWLSVPFLFWVLTLMIKNRQYALFVILSPALFNILFYALISLNIPRYQMTAAPGFAISLALGFTILLERGKFDWIKRKSNRT